MCDIAWITLAVGAANLYIILSYFFETFSVLCCVSAHAFAVFPVLAELRNRFVKQNVCFLHLLFHPASCARHVLAFLLEDCFCFRFCFHSYLLEVAFILMECLFVLLSSLSIDMARHRSGSSSFPRLFPWLVHEFLPSCLRIEVAHVLVAIGMRFFVHYLLSVLL